MHIRRFSMNAQDVQSDVGEAYGLEIEVENGRVPTSVNSGKVTSWRVVGDGSLRNGGIEFVSKPLGWRRIMKCIDMFYKWRKSYKYETSVRTSIHVHANVLDHTHHQVAASLAAHAILEPLLFLLCGPQREENIYCVPWYRTPEETRLLRGVAAGKLNNSASTCKYSSLYTEPLGRFGTLEFRHAPVFDSKEELVRWMEVVRAISYGVPDKWGNAQEVVDGYHAVGTDGFVETVLGKEIASDLRIMAGEETLEDVIERVDSVAIAEKIIPKPKRKTKWERDVAAKTARRGNNYRRVVFR